MLTREVTDEINEKDVTQTGGGSEEMRPVEPNAMEEILDDDLDQVSGGASFHASTTTQRRTSSEYESLKFKYSTPGEPKDAKPRQCQSCFETLFTWCGGVPILDKNQNIVGTVQMFKCTSCGSYYYAKQNPTGGYYSPHYYGKVFYGHVAEENLC